MTLKRRPGSPGSPPRPATVVARERQVWRAHIDRFPLGGNLLPSPLAVSALVSATVRGGHDDTRRTARRRCGSQPFGA